MVSKTNFQDGTKKYIGTVAEKTALTGMQAFDKYLETDVPKIYVYSGTAWVEITAIANAF